ncbi:MAG: hypothetical protein RQ966_18260 [Acetobacteraceae bacterium]|nr:hypothetical protein [Acetobacteraceae bacterium]
MARLPGKDDVNPAESVSPQAAPPLRRHTRRLEDKLLVAFHHACDVADIEVARHVLEILELMLARKTSQPDPNRRRNMEGLVAGHERLWSLRNREN